MEARRQFVVPAEVADDLGALAARVCKQLDLLRCRSRRPAVTKDGFTIHAAYGRQLVALLSPFDLLGYFSTVALRIRVRRDPSGGGDATLHLRVWPTDEIWETPEQWQATQAGAERIGDGLQVDRVARRVGRALVDARIARVSGGGASDRASRPTSASFLCGLAALGVVFFVPTTGLTALAAIALGLAGALCAAIALDRATSRKTDRQARTALWLGLSAAAFAATAFGMATMGA